MGRTKTTRNYESARAFVRALNLADTHAWHAYAASDARPKDIPANPWVSYKAYFDERGEKFSINDFIGAKVKRGRPNLKNREAVETPALVETEKTAYEIAKELVQALQLKNRAEFTELSKNGKRPDGVPARPDLTFEEWNGWREFLGTATTV